MNERENDKLWVAESEECVVESVDGNMGHPFGILKGDRYLT